VRAGKDLKTRFVLAPGSEELRRIYTEAEPEIASIDTCGASGYAPLTPTEDLVLAVEGFLNSPDFKAAFPDTGQDLLTPTRFVQMGGGEEAGEGGRTSDIIESSGAMVRSRGACGCRSRWMGARWTSTRALPIQDSTAGVSDDQHRCRAVDPRTRSSPF
jgi:hypothetical protein